MKNIRLIIVSAILMNFIHCKAQIYPLNSDFDSVPANSHLKDINNELAPFVGIYKGTYQGNETTLYVTKVEDKLQKTPNKTYYMDALVVKYIVKNSSGTILIDTKNFNGSEFYSISSVPQENAVVFYYAGTNCRVGHGTVFLFRINNNQLKWIYRPEGKIFVNKDEECPGNPDTKVYLPVTEDLIFTKQ